MDANSVVSRFNDAFAAQDLAALTDLLTPDAVFEDTAPPDGGRHVGRDAVLAAFSAFFASSPTARFDSEDVVSSGSWVTVRWRYSWGETPGDQGHVRGVDVIRVKDGRVAEKLSYVKG